MRWFWEKKTVDFIAEPSKIGIRGAYIWQGKTSCGVDEINLRTMCKYDFIKNPHLTYNPDAAKGYDDDRDEKKMASKAQNETLLAEPTSAAIQGTYEWNGPASCGIDSVTLRTMCHYSLTPDAHVKFSAEAKDGYVDDRAKKL